MPTIKTERFYARGSQYSSFDIFFTQMHTVNVLVHNHVTTVLIELLGQIFRPNIGETCQKSLKISVANICP